MQSDFRRSAGPRCLAAGPATGSPAALTPSISAVRARFVPGPVDRPCRCQVAGFRKALNILVPRQVSKEGLLGSRIRENAGDVTRILTNAATQKSRLTTHYRNCWYSQARAYDQWRLVVRTEMPSTSAACSIVSPTK